jgi:hypothetical protein
MYVRTLFGQDFVLDGRCRDFFFISFLGSSYRETPKNAIKKIGKGEGSYMVHRARYGNRALVGEWANVPGSGS